MASGYIADLSSGQRQIRMAELLRPGDTRFAMPLVVRIAGPLDPSALQAALAAVVRRHDSLRTSFPMVEGRPVQAVADDATLPLRMVQAAVAGAEFEDRVRALAQDMVATPFDLASGPLVRVCLIRGTDEAALVAVFHHVVGDGASLDLFLRDLTVAYDAVLRGGDDSVDPLPLQYADFADWEQQHQASAAAGRGLSVWRERLRSAPATLDLPFDRRRRAETPSRSAQAQLLVAGDAAARLAELARGAGTTAFTLWLALFFVLLRRWSGLEDLVVTVPVSKRDRPELADLIGLLVDTLPIRVTIDAQTRFPALLDSVRDVLRDALAHRDLSFERIVQASGVERQGDTAPFMQVLFGVEDVGRTQFTALDGTRFERVAERLEQAAKADLSVVCGAGADGLRLWCRYDAGLFEPETIDRLLGWFGRLVRAVAADPNQPVLEIPLVEPDEGPALIARFNTSRRPYERDRSVADLFYDCARRDPGAIAIEEHGRARPYGEVAHGARRLASVLAAEGVRAGDVVLLVLPVSAALIEAQLAVLTLGAVYAPVDPADPSDHRHARAALVAARHAIVSDAAARGAVEKELAAAGCATLAWDELLLRADSAAPHPGTPADAGSPAYVMFTSGSTGEPKGVSVPHRGIVRLVLGSGLVGGMAGLRAAVHSNPAFDASTLEIWAPLLNGGTAVPVDRTVVMDPRALRLFLAEARITLIWLTAGLFQQIAAVDPGALAGPRTVFTGGDVVSPAGARAVLAAGHGTGLMLVNGYGPTENTTFSTTFDIGRLGEDEPSVPIGTPIANSTVYVLDPAGRPLPPGVVGEIWVGGDGVALGYVGDPRLTAARFRPDPFSDESGARMYRTGDLGRWRADGTLVFVGRADSQVKVRGFRVELGAIEAALVAHPGVAGAAVVAPRRESGERDLVACVVPKPGMHLTASELRRHLQSRLPRQLLPHAFAVLDALPLNANGKVDTRALARIEIADAEPAACVEPRTPEERIVARIWADLLGRPPASIEDNFFHVGGDSLLTIRLVARAFEAGLDVDLKDVFEHPTVEGIAAVATRRKRAAAAETSGARHGVELLPAAADLRRPCRYVSIAVDVAVSAVDLGCAVQHLAERHDALRLALVDDTGGRRLVVSDVLPAVPVRFVDVPDATRDDLDAWIAANRDRLSRGIDLADGVTIAATLVKHRAGPSRTHGGSRKPSPASTVVLAIHEAIADDRALLLLATDLESALVTSDGIRLPTPPPRFSRWLSWLSDHAAGEPVRAAAMAREAAVPAGAPVFVDAADLATVRARLLLDAQATRLLLEDLPGRLALSPLDGLLVALGAGLSTSAAVEIVDGRRALPATALWADSAV
ncbi:non-ribosomal peptide synthetase, partial [Rhodoplanes roseus]|uniref:non-ribosomal peptide synthetase n=1 Tax=Rhodoplanes roseus TaxID=29409 RepID=UPI0011B85764